jgi:predicted Zn-dependent peptidase
MRRFTKADLIAFAQNYLNKQQAVVIYKQEGDDLSVETVEKPAITPVEINRNQSSDYAKGFNALTSAPIEPAFVDYDQELKQDQIGGKIPLDYLFNENNQTFELVYVFEMGKLHDNLLPLAFKYLRFLGTDRYTSTQLQQEFFKLGLSFEVSVRDDVAYISLSGLDRNFGEGVQLMEHILTNAVGDKNILNNLVTDLKKDRLDRKKDKQFILKRALLSYAYYGHNSPFKSILDNNLLEVIQPKDLIKYIHGLAHYEHRIFYYGSQKKAKVKALLEQHHSIPKLLKPCPKPHRYIQQTIDTNRVVFVHYEGMVQAEVLTVSKGEANFDLNRHIDARLYNEYFGYGLSSIVFQEIRESKALAYSAFAFYNSPEKKDKAHYFTTYIGTQSDKLQTAIRAMDSIVQQMPIDRSLIHQASQSILKKMQSERLNGADIYWDKRANLKRGFDRNTRKDVYERYELLSKDAAKAVEAAEQFQQQNVRGQAKYYLVLGDKNQIDIDFLQSLGVYEELTLKELFGY